MSHLATAAAPLHLGLIGDNIARSSAPRLHRLAGEQNGIEVIYDRLVPKDRGEDFETLFAGCRSGGYRGINITYPYKERAAPLVEIEDPLVRAIGAVNTVVFDGETARGYNTDHSGFMAAYRKVRANRDPGRVLIIGTGGVGRAVAFGLVGLGAKKLCLVDRDWEKAEALACDLQAIDPDLVLVRGTHTVAAAIGVQGIVNCTPVGMAGYEGTPLAGEHMEGAEWAFDAVYTPSDTQFLTDANERGLTIISGWELFFFQGVHAWKVFAGLPLDEAALRTSLQSEGPRP